jgi:hypothetical protein
LVRFRSAGIIGGWGYKLIKVTEKSRIYHMEEEGGNNTRGVYKYIREHRH